MEENINWNERWKKHKLSYQPGSNYPDNFDEVNPNTQQFFKDWYEGRLPISGEVAAGKEAVPIPVEDEEDIIPDGFKHELKTITTWHMRQPSAVIWEFVIPTDQAPYDEYLKDKLGSQGYDDIQHVIAVFLDSGYAQEEIEPILEKLWLNKEITLIKPVNVPIYYHVRETPEHKDIVGLGPFKPEPQPQPPGFLSFTFDGFEKWIKERGYARDARPFTGIYKGGERIGTYVERGGGIEVQLYEKSLEQQPGPEPKKFKLKIEHWSPAVTTEDQPDIGTIRTDPENYYVATILKTGELVFDGIEPMTRDIDQIAVRGWYEIQTDKSTVSQTVTPERAREIIEQAQGRIKMGRAIGPWSDQIKHIITKGERQYVNEEWEKMPGTHSFVDALYEIGGGYPIIGDTVIDAEGNEFLITHIKVGTGRYQGETSVILKAERGEKEVAMSEVQMFYTVKGKPPEQQPGPEPTPPTHTPLPTIVGTAKVEVKYHDEDNITISFIRPHGRYNFSTKLPAGASTVDESAKALKKYFETIIELRGL